MQNVKFSPCGGFSQIASHISSISQFKIQPQIHNPLLQTPTIFCRKSNGTQNVAN